MQWPNMDQEGDVFLCTFPTCWKKIMEEDGLKRACLVKADVDRQHSLKKNNIQTVYDEMSRTKVRDL